MNLNKWLERVHYLLTQPANALRLIRATLENRFHHLTLGYGPRRVSCNLCGFSGRHFDWFRERSFVQKNAQCPVCNSLPRNRMLVEHLAGRCELRGAWVLDVSPPSHYRRWFTDRGAHYISIDLGERTAMARMDLTRLAFPDHSFDLVICSHVLEHVPAYETALSEMRRVVKERGRVIVDIPFSRRPASIRLARPDHQGHFHSFGLEVIDRIRAAGFALEIKNYSAELDPETPANQFFVLTKSD